MHDLMKEPMDCGLCNDDSRLVEARFKGQDRRADHRAAQNRAIAQAVREAAGEMNPVKWVLSLDEDFASPFPILLDALRRIVGQKESA